MVKLHSVLTICAECRYTGQRQKKTAVQSVGRLNLAVLSAKLSISLWERSGLRQCIARCPSRDIFLIIGV